MKTFKLCDVIHDEFEGIICSMAQLKIGDSVLIVQTSNFKLTTNSENKICKAIGVKAVSLCPKIEKHLEQDFLKENEECTLQK